jgi:quercetin dioxygenase-like cupin family protein
MSASPDNEIKKSNVHVIVEILDYQHDAVVSKSIIKKSSGTIVVTSLDDGEETADKKVPFDTYVQVLDGAAEVIIDEKKYNLKTGEGIVIPAFASHCFNANEKFKMITTIIKQTAE